MRAFNRIFSLILTHKIRLLFGISFLLAFAALSVLPAWYIKDVVDYVAAQKNREINEFITFGFMIMAFYVFKGIAYFGQNYLMGSLGQLVVKELREMLFKQVVRMPVTFFNKRPTGELISRFTIDVTTLNEAIRTGINAPLRDIPQILFLLSILVYRSWKLSLVMMVLLPFAAWAISKFGQQNKMVTTKRLNKFSALTNLLNETITGIRVVKAFSMEQYEDGRFEKENQGLFRSFIHAVRIESYSYPSIELIGAVCAAVFLPYGGYLLINGQITGGDFASFIASFYLLNEPIKKLNNLTLKLQEGNAAAIRVFDLIDQETEMEVEMNNSSIPMTLPTMRKEIRINISKFSYEGEEEVVLRDINISMRAGTITALVGASGSGKTTLSNLIPRFYEIAPEDGSILIDQQDIRVATFKSLRDQIAIVTQDIVLFNDTIANNISYGNIECSREKIIEASKIAFADRFINEMPDKYDQIVGERGVRLSGGQRQRIAISRALIKNAPILILDEATSALDTESEKEVQAAIENLMKNRTTLVIAHRLSTIQHADVIHVMSEGQIVESGTHKELLNRNGEYRKLYDIQFQNPKTV